MAGRPPQLDHIRDAFLDELVKAKGLVATIQTLPKKVHPNAPNGIHPKHVTQVVGLAFMGVISAWEEFLERTLVRYVAGGTTGTGHSPMPKFGRAKSISHAYELLSQDANYDSQKHYLKVSEARWVWRTADFFFSQHNYGLLTSKADLLANANRIRNRVAHDSKKCKADFKAASIWFLQPANNNLTRGYSPGDLLLSTATRNFGPQINIAAVSHFEAYMRIFEALAKGIVP